MLLLVHCRLFGDQRLWSRVWHLSHELFIACLNARALMIARSWFSPLVQESTSFLPIETLFWVLLVVQCWCCSNLRTWIGNWWSVLEAILRLLFRIKRTAACLGSLLLFKLAFFLPQICLQNLLVMFSLPLISGDCHPWLVYWYLFLSPSHLSHKLRARNLPLQVLLSQSYAFFGWPHDSLLLWRYFGRLRRRLELKHFGSLDNLNASNRALALSCPCCPLCLLLRVFFEASHIEVSHSFALSRFFVAGYELIDKPIHSWTRWF